MSETAVEVSEEKETKKKATVPKIMTLSCIHIIGDGGIGSNLSLPLLKFLKNWTHNNYRRNPYGISIKIHDGDRVELSNLDRQHFLPIDVGRPKAEITTRHLQSMIRHLNIGNMSVHANTNYLKEDNISDYISDGSVIFLAVDNHKTRVMVENFMLTQRNILCINGGNELTDGEVQTMWKYKGKWITPKLTQLHPEIKKSKDKYPDEQSCEEAAISEPQLSIVNNACAQYMLEAFYSWLESNEVIWIEKFFDLKTGAVRPIYLNEYNKNKKAVKK